MLVSFDCDSLSERELGEKEEGRRRSGCDIGFDIGERNFGAGMTGRGKVWRVRGRGRGVDLWGGHDFE